MVRQDMGDDRNYSAALHLGLKRRNKAAVVILERPDVDADSLYIKRVDLRIEYFGGRPNFINE